jgi:hypothetical protein
MTCLACSRAQSDPTRDDYAARCDGCLARAMAALGGHVESVEAGAVTPRYRRALEKLFGERWRDMDAEVRSWGDLITAARRRAVAASKLEGRS